MSLVILGNNYLVSDLGLGRFKILVECHISEESDIIMAPTVVLILKACILVFVWLKDNMASGNKEESLGIPALTNKETTSTLSPKRRLAQIGRPNVVVRGSRTSTI